MLPIAIRSPKARIGGGVIILKNLIIVNFFSCESKKGRRYSVLSQDKKPNLWGQSEIPLGGLARNDGLAICDLVSKRRGDYCGVKY